MTSRTRLPYHAALVLVICVLASSVFTSRLLFASDLRPQSFAALRASTVREQNVTIPGPTTGKDSPFLQLARQAGSYGPYILYADSVDYNSDTGRFVS